MIIDVHTHAWDIRQHATDRFLAQTGISRGQSIPIDIRFDDYLRAMEPVERAIVFGMKARLAGLYVPNDYIAGFVARAPAKLIGFMSLDPTEPYFMDDLERSYQELGLRGIKLAPIYAGFDPREPALDILYARAQELGLPILFHTGTTFVSQGPLDVTRPFLIDEVARRFPDLRIIMAHLGHPWEGECIAVIRKHPHVYADIAAIHYRPWQFYNSLVLCQEYGVMHKLLFGSDYPFSTPAESLAGIPAVNRFTEGTHLPRIAGDALDAVIHRNALELLGLN